MAEHFEEGLPVAWYMKVIVLRIQEQMSCMPEITHYDINICHFGAMDRTVRRDSGLPPDRLSELSPIDTALFAYLSLDLPQPEPFNEFIWDHQKKVHVFRAPVKNKIAGSERYASSANEVNSTTRLGHFNEAIRTSAKPLGVFQAVSRFNHHSEVTSLSDEYNIKAALAFVHYLLAGLEVLDAANASRTDNLASEIVEYLAAMVTLVTTEGDSEDKRILRNLIELLGSRKTLHPHVSGKFREDGYWSGTKFQSLWVGRSAYGEMENIGGSISQKSQVCGLFNEYITPGKTVDQVLAPNDTDFAECYRMGNATVNLTDNEGNVPAAPLIVDPSMEVPDFQYVNQDLLDFRRLHERRPTGDRTEAFRTINQSMQAIEQGVIESRDCRAVAVAYLCLCYDGYPLSRPHLAECGEVQYAIGTFEEVAEAMEDASIDVQNWIRDVIGLLKVLCQIQDVLSVCRNQMPERFSTQGVDINGVRAYTGHDMRKQYLSISKPNGTELYLPEPRRSEEFKFGNAKFKLSLSRNGQLKVSAWERIKDIAGRARPSEVQVGLQLPMIFNMTATWKTGASAKRDGEQWTKIANRILCGQYGHEATLWFISLVSVSGDISLTANSTNCSYMRSIAGGVKGRVDEPLSQYCASSLGYIYCAVKDKLYWTDRQRRPEVYEVTYDEGKGSFRFQHVPRVEGDLDSYVRVRCLFRRGVQ